MGIYDAVIKERQLERIWPTDGHEKRRMQVDAEVQRIQDEDPMVYNIASHAATRYTKVRIARAKLKKLLKAIDLELEAMTRIVVETYESQGAKSIKLDNGVTIRIQSEPTAKALDHDLIRAWAIGDGLERSLQLPYPTMNALTKVRCKEGKPAIPGTKMGFRTKIVPTGLKHALEALGLEEEGEEETDE
jgi:hypothetical protein